MFNHRRKRLAKLITLLLIVSMCILPSTVVEAASQAVVSGSAKTQFDIMYKPTVNTVDLSITGKAANMYRVIPNDVVLIMDESGSMGLNNKIGALREAAIKFVSSVDLSFHRVGLVGFEGSIAINQPFTTDVEELKKQLSTVRASGGTIVGPAIDAAVDMLKASKRADAKPTIILLTDGEAGDPAAMLQAAQKAKSEGFIFYTIALLDDETDAEHNDINIQLRELATTYAHHHFVGVGNLSTVYEAISKDVGVENPYNVTLVQKIADEFEYVIGSADNNIPAPTVNGNTITWDMLEVKNSTIPFTYKIKAADGTDYGTYNVCEESYVTWELYDGTVVRADIPSPKVTLCEYVPPIIKSMTPDTGVENKEQAIKVLHEGINYASDFAVIINGKEVKVGSTGSDYFKFTAPGLPRGSYSVKMRNYGMTENVGTYKVEALPTEELIFGTIDKTSGEAGQKTLEKVVMEQGRVPADLIVTVDDIACRITSQGSDYFKFYTPDSLTAGTYNVKALTSGKYYSLGQYTAIPKKVPPVTFGKINVTEGDEGQKVLEKVLMLDGTRVPDDLTVSIDGIDCRITSSGSDYFKFNIPTELAGGDYEVIATTNGTDYSLGTYTVREKVDPVLEFTTIDVPSGEKGQATTEKVLTLNGMSVPDDLIVTVNGIACRITSRGSDYFKFNIPADLDEGDYEVKAVTNGTDYSLGTYTVTPKVVPPVDFGTISITSGEEGQSVTEKVLTLNGTRVPDDLIVTVNDIACRITSSGSDYFKFNVPTELAAGDYEVKAVTNGTSYSLGIYTVNAKPAKVPTFSALTVASGFVDKSYDEKIVVSNADGLPSDLEVFFDGSHVDITTTGYDYFKFKIPEGYSSGTYPVTVMFNGTVYTIGDFTKEDKPVQLPEFSAMSVTSGRNTKAVAVKVVFGNANGCPSDLEVLIDGVTPAKITSSGSDYFKFSVPKGIATGDHQISVIFDGNTYDLGTYNAY